MAMNPTITAKDLPINPETKPAAESREKQPLAPWAEDFNGAQVIRLGYVKFKESNGKFKATYGANLDDDGFVTALYHNVHHREPDQAGLEFWLHSLADGTYDRADVLIRFSESNENIHNVHDAIKDGISLSNDFLNM